MNSMYFRGATSITLTTPIAKMLCISNTLTKISQETKNLEPSHFAASIAIAEPARVTHQRSTIATQIW